MLQTVVYHRSSDDPVSTHPAADVEATLPRRCRSPNSCDSRGEEFLPRWWMTKTSLDNLTGPHSYWELDSHKKATHHKATAAETNSLLLSLNNRFKMNICWFIMIKKLNLFSSQSVPECCSQETHSALSLVQWPTRSKWAESCLVGYDNFSLLPSVLSFKSLYFLLWWLWTPRSLCPPVSMLHEKKTHYGDHFH